MTVSPSRAGRQRLNELRDAGLAYTTGDSRTTRLGCPAQVWLPLEQGIACDRLHRELAQR